MIIKCMKDSVGTLPTSGESISDIGKDLTGDYNIYELDESINTSEFDLHNDLFRETEESRVRR